ncbi:hypothetical protein [Enterococcus thailandicus]|uniref:hypothetical protein n=1 Tax=Enterococcus thailandicus TaxID=417368 RepID=UPI003B59029B
MSSINDVLKRHPNLYKKLNSEQRNLSTKLLKIRLKNKKSVSEFSKLLNLSEKEYLEFEFGDIHIPVTEYNKLLKRVDNLSYLKPTIVVVKVNESIKYNYISRENATSSNNYLIAKNKTRSGAASDVNYAMDTKNNRNSYIVKEEEVSVYG